MMATILPKIEGKLITAVDICWIAPSSYFNQEFMMYQLLSPAFQNKVNKLTSGSTRKRISKGNLTSFELFLPPLSEQSRIAAKIAQLFALLRKVESLLK
ncbi:restriction endonuclease subunit S [Lactobacillus crispatus]|uniref:restriction endonuclease subunit S n=1 Tax=Lactobacillus crispatus TaxID=47770 RepID=UPI0018E2F8A1|nr:restriction endonuclease subunit S [Lactobacillus crispatus]